MGKLSIFDVVGPVMVGPSSSHTAGAARIGNACYKMLEDDLESVTFYLHGSFGKTYKGHGTDRALLAGVMGYEEDSEELREAFDIADAKEIKYKFVEDDLGNVHPNTVKIVAVQMDGEVVELIGSSIGGGNIKIIEINNIPIQVSGSHPVFLAKYDGSRGAISGVAGFMNDHGYDIMFMSFNKIDDVTGTGLIVVEVDKKISEMHRKEFTKTIPGIIEAYVIQ